jgi:Ca2+-binding EF-hand superfamily protein
MARPGGPNHSSDFFEVTMRKILLSLGLLSVMTLCGRGAFAADEDTKPKKGKLGEKLKDKFGEKLKDKLDTDKLFEKLDANSDGKVSKEEFKKIFGNVAGKLVEQFGEKVGDVTDLLFDRLDTDSDGYLSKEEFKKVGGLLGGFGNGELKDKLKGFKGKGGFGKRGEKEEKKQEEK